VPGTERVGMGKQARVSSETGKEQANDKKNSPRMSRRNSDNRDSGERRAVCALT
jgi:hypothetical protein